MKFSLIAFLIPFCAFAQTEKPALNILPEVDGVVKYEEVVKLSDSTTTQTELYNRARIWFTEHYNSANNVLQMDDKESGILIGKGVAPFSFEINLSTKEMNKDTRQRLGDSVKQTQKLNLSHAIKIYVKKGKYKYELTDLDAMTERQRIGSYTSEPYSLPVVNSGYKAKPEFQVLLLRAVNSEANKIITLLKLAMMKPVAGKSDW